MPSDVAWAAPEQLAGYDLPAKALEVVRDAFRRLALAPGGGSNDAGRAQLMAALGRDSSLNETKSDYRDYSSDGAFVSQPLADLVFEAQAARKVC